MIANPNKSLDIIKTKDQIYDHTNCKDYNSLKQKYF